VDVNINACFGGLLMLGLLNTTHVQAACKQLAGFETKVIEMGMGAVIVRRDTPVGGVIVTRTFPIPVRPNSDNGGERFATCRGGGQMIGAILQGLPVTGISSVDTPVYSTDVAGIGIRLSRTVGAGSQFRTVYYPHSLAVNTGTSGAGDFYFAPVNGFQVDLVKTAANTGSGALSSGLYTSYYADGDGMGKPVMVTRLAGNATTIVSATCSVGSSDKNQVVNLLPIGQHKFTHPGFTGGERAFFISIYCNQSIPGQERRVGLRWDGLYQHRDKLPGVLAPVTNTRARGVAIQLLSGSAPVRFDDAVQWLPGQSSVGGFTVPIVARYYQTAQVVSAGSIQAVARFSLTYQ